MTVSDVLRFELAAIVIAFGLVILFKLLNGSINMRGLLGGSDTAVTAVRVQSLTVSLVIAASWLSRFPAAQGRIPDITTEELAILGGSQAIYLGGKTFDLFDFARFFARR